MTNGADGGRRMLPPGWAWTTLGEICEIVGGITVDARRQDDHLVEVPYLRVANVQRGSLDLSVVKRIRVSTEQARRLELRPNDVLLNEGGDKDKVGRGWVWSGEIEPCIHQNHIFRARPLVDGMDGRWISAYANELGRSYFFEQTKQTTNLASISLSKVRTLPIPVAPLAEQHRIWRRVEQLFDEIEAGEQELQKAREGLEIYRRAVLKAAVSGDLTRDWRKKNGSNETGADYLSSILARRRGAWIQSNSGKSKKYDEPTWANHAGAVRVAVKLDLGRPSSAWLLRQGKVQTPATRRRTPLWRRVSIHTDWRRPPQRRAD